MALAIDTKPLAHHYIPELQRDLDNYAGGRTRRFQINQVYAHATIFHDASTIQRVYKEKALRWATQALHWQADPDDDVNEMEVFQYLQYLAKTSPLLATAVSQTKCTNASTSLFSSCAVQSPPVLTGTALGRPLNSFHRYCTRWSILAIWGNDLSMCESAIPEVFPTAPKLRGWWPYLELRIEGANRSLGNKPAVVWHLQFDFVDLLSPRSYPSRRPGKRRRTTFNRFNQVPSASVQAAFHHPEAKRFNGVRYRRDRRTWSAEMRPPKCKNKVDFGEFKSQVEAARAVDAAFYFYGKPEFLNFPDFTRQILPTSPSPPRLDEKGMKKFVKEQAKWLASIASGLPATPPPVPSEIPESSLRSCAADTSSGILSFPQIASFLSSDDGTFISQPWLHSDPMANWVSNGLMEPNSVGTPEEEQIMFQCSSLNGLADPFSCAQELAKSSVHITDGWDGAEHYSAPALTNFVNPSLPSCESQRTWMESLLMSPPFPVIPMPPSPSDFQDDDAHELLEQQLKASEGNELWE